MIFLLNLKQCLLILLEGDSIVNAFVYCDATRFLLIFISVLLIFFILLIFQVKMGTDVLTLSNLFISRRQNRVLNEDQVNKEKVGFSAFMEANKNNMHKWWKTEIRCKSDLKPNISICKRFAAGQECDSKCSFFHPPDIQPDNQVSLPTLVPYEDTFSPSVEKFEGLANLKTEKKIKVENMECENNINSETKKKKKEKRKKSKKKKRHHRSDDEYDSDIQVVEVVKLDPSNVEYNRSIKMEKLNEGIPEPTTVASSVLVSCENKSPVPNNNIVDLGNVMTDGLNFLKSEMNSHLNHNLVSGSSIVNVTSCMDAIASETKLAHHFSDTSRTESVPDNLSHVTKDLKVINHNNDNSHDNESSVPACSNLNSLNTANFVPSKMSIVNNVSEKFIKTEKPISEELTVKVEMVQDIVNVKLETVHEIDRSQSLKRRFDGDHAHDSSPKMMKIEVPVQHENFSINIPPNYSNIDQSFLDSCTRSIETYIKKYDLMKIKDEKLCSFELLCRYVEQSKLKLLSLQSHPKLFVWDVYIRLFFVTFYDLYGNFDNDYRNMINKSLSEKTLHEFMTWVKSEVKQNSNRT